jgi:hypothetical protein
MAPQHDRKVYTRAQKGLALCRFTRPDESPFADPTQSRIESAPGNPDKFPRSRITAADEPSPFPFIGAPERTAPKRLTRNSLKRVRLRPEEQGVIDRVEILPSGRRNSRGYTALAPVATRSESIRFSEPYAA